MRVLFWYCKNFAWTPTLKTLEDAPTAAPGGYANVVVAFVHVEPRDVQTEAPPRLTREKRKVGGAKMGRLAGHPPFLYPSGGGEGRSRTGEGPPGPYGKRLNSAGYTAVQTPYGYFNDLAIDAPGHPLARIFKEF